MLFDERNDEFFQVAGLANLWIRGVVSVPRLFFETHLYNDQIVVVVSIHLFEYTETVAVTLVKAFFDRKHVQDTVVLALVVAVRKENTNLLLAVLVLRLDRVDPNAIPDFNVDYLRLGFLTEDRAMSLGYRA
jgi:hypothetical protein